MKEVQVYVDGSCLGNPGPIAVGVVFLVKGQVKVLSEYFGFGTGNIAEIKAAILALKSIKNKSLKVVLYSDSQLVVGMLSKGWKAKANKKLVSELLCLASGFKEFEVLKVKAHSNDGSRESFWNDCCDKLAKGAVASKESFSAKWFLGK